MIIDIATPSHPAELGVSAWASAEILDTPLTGGLRLRALVFRLGAGQWQWSICAIDDDRGELVSIGTEKTAAAARSTAASEIAKCLESPLLDG